MILVSACLLGIKCRYDGKDSRDENVVELVEDTNECVIPACPEQLGGLPTPRDPTHLTDSGRKIIEGKGKAIMEGGKDVTPQFLKGAKETLRIAQLFDVDKAILKSGSPSCGVEKFPSDGGEKKDGAGVTAAILEKNDIKVIRNEEI